MQPTSLEGEALIAAHKQATRRLQLVGLAFPLVVIAIIVLNLISISNQIQNADTAAIANLTAQRLGALWPEIEKELSEVTAAVEPAFGDAIDREATALGPQLEQRLEKDVAAITESAQHDFAKTMETAIKDLDEKQREALIAELPELANDAVAQERVLAVSREKLATWSESRFETTLESHVDAISSIRDTLKKSYTAPEGTDAKPEDAMVVWLELLNESIGGDTVLAVAEKHDEPDSAARGLKRK